MESAEYSTPPATVVQNSCTYGAAQSALVVSSIIDGARGKCHICPLSDQKCCCYAIFMAFFKLCQKSLLQWRRCENGEW